MKFSSKYAGRSLAIALVTGISLASMVNITHAQYGAAGQESPGRQGNSTKPSLDKESKSGMESGEVDQRIRVERNKGVEPSLPPPVRKDKKGRPIEDPDTIQGGSIGPN